MLGFCLNDDKEPVYKTITIFKNCDLAKGHADFFEKEALALTAVSHENLLDIEILTKGGRLVGSNGNYQDNVYYAVLEMNKNASFFDFLYFTGRFGERVTRYYFRQLVYA